MYSLSGPAHDFLKDEAVGLGISASEYVRRIIDAERKRVARRG